MSPADDEDSLDHLNATGRLLKDHVVVVDTRGSGSLASRIEPLAVQNFAGFNGDGSLDLHGLDIRQDQNTLQILLVNHRPSIDPVTGELLDATKVGANSTIEQFQTEVGSSSMRYVRTYAHEVIQTPNRVAWVNDHAFVFTNDHSEKVGTVRFPYDEKESILTEISAVLLKHCLGEAQSATAIEMAATSPTHLASTFQMVSSEAPTTSYMCQTPPKRKSASSLSPSTIFCKRFTRLRVYCPWTIFPLTVMVISLVPHFLDHIFLCDLLKIRSTLTLQAV